MEGVAVPVLSVGLMDLARSTAGAFAEIRDGVQVTGNGTFGPSFGEGTRAIDSGLTLDRRVFITFLSGYAGFAFESERL